MEVATEKKYNIIIDFDSTFAQVEALEELADIILKDSPEKNRILDEIKHITNLGVDGKITFSESLSRRLGLMRIHKSHLEKLVRRLKRNISTSFSRNKAFFKKYEGKIYIVSNGFKDFIDPVVKPYGINEDHVLANTFVFDQDGWVTGVDQENPLAHSKGKSRVLKSLDLPGESYVIGDAYTDFEMVEAGIAHKFFAFTENVLRESIIDKADHITPSFDEFLYVNKMPRALSYPKNRIKVLLMNGVHPAAAERFETEGYQVESMESNADPVKLEASLKEASILGVSSHIKVDAELLSKAPRLMAVGLFDVAAGRIDLTACASRGVAVFNAPYTNTRSQVELAIGNMIALLRQTHILNQQMKEGHWQQGIQPGFEIRNKKLGIIGYGHAGSQLSVLGEALGMDVYYFDLIEKQALGNATKCHTLKELLKKVDIVSIHVDARSENKAFFDKSAFKAMRKNSILINLSVGTAVDQEALVQNLKSGKLLGVAIDVFPTEPAEGEEDFQSPLREFPNVILTPHINGNTKESQRNTGVFVPKRIIDYINAGNTFGSVNFPELQLPAQRRAHRLIHVHLNQPGMLAQINSVLAQHKINILGQYLKTNNDIGYVITDIDKKYGKKVLKDLKEIEHTIKFRVLY